MDIIKELESLKREHYICDDCWYSCPKSNQCCDDEREYECSCNADNYNAKIDNIINYIRNTQWI